MQVLVFHIFGKHGSIRSIESMSLQEIDKVDSFKDLFG